MSNGRRQSSFFKVTGVAEVFRSFDWLEPLGDEKVSLLDARGRVLATGIGAEADMPHFDRAVMDGYAVRAADTFGCSESQPSYLNCRGSVAMGSSTEGRSLLPGEALRIDTGGMLPPGADAVVMWEVTREEEDLLEVWRPVAPGENVARAGDDVKAGERILEKGRFLRPADIGLLAGLGFEEVSVYRRPKVAVLSTGDELVAPGENPGPGRIRNVNQYSLGAWIGHFGAEPLLLGIVSDDLEEIQARAVEGLGKSDMMLISGGSSAGTRDHTRKVVEDLGDPGLLYHGLAIRPGKPTVIGASGGRPVFGLPGHPVSAMVIFLVLVRPVLNRMLGLADVNGLTRIPARLGDSLPSQTGREDYYQVRLSREGDDFVAEPVFRKSGLVSAMVRGVGMVRVPPEKEGLEEGERVDVEIYS
jgi:molybdopterin molybdotransferase